MHEPLRRLGRRGLSLIPLAAVVALEVGCATSQQQASSRPPDVFAQIRAVDFRPPVAQSAPPFEVASQTEGPQAQSYYGDTVPAIRAGQKSGQTKQTFGDDGAGQTGSDGALTTGSIA